MSRHQDAVDGWCGGAGGELATEASELSWAMHCMHNVRAWCKLDN
jgi:hypothetical protein